MKDSAAVCRTFNLLSSDLYIFHVFTLLINKKWALAIVTAATSGTNATPQLHNSLYENS